MKAAIMQPYFLPYIGYFQLINAVDKYILYDDVQFIKGGWINRNNMLLNRKKFMFNLLMLGATPNKLINEISVQSNQNKLLKTIEISYKKAPYFGVVFPIINEILNYGNLNLARYLGNSIIEICSYLKIETEIIYSSTIQKNNSLKAQDKVINICKSLQVTTYINAIGGQELYNKDVFNEDAISLLFLKSNLSSYPQFNNEFIPWLSIIDIMMFNSVAEIQLMLNNYTLI